MPVKTFERLGPTETQLVGRWREAEEAVVGDDVSERIKFLIRECLVEIGSDPSGWDTLFQDPEDGRYWERTFPNGNWHGGGPATLSNLSEKDAKSKYADLFS